MMKNLKRLKKLKKKSLSCLVIGSFSHPANQRLRFVNSEEAISNRIEALTLKKFKKKSLSCLANFLWVVKLFEF